MYCDFLGYLEKITFYVKSAVTAFLGKFWKNLGYV